MAMAMSATTALLLDAADISSSSSSDGDSLDAYVQQLRECLCAWDPATGRKNAAMRDFVDALTEIAALPLDAMSMEVRRLLVDGPDQAVGAIDSSARGANADTSSALASHDSADDDAGDSSSTPVAHILAALSSRDVLLKCKAANALGSLCISRVAGQHLLDRHGAVALARLVRMATCKNRWAQGDAFFVLGWIVVIADDAMLQQIARLVPSVVKFLHQSVHVGAPRDRDSATARGRGRGRRKAATGAPSSEDASNFRVYALVLLLNCLQRDASIFARASVAQHQLLVETLHALVQTLNAHDVQTPARSSPATTSTASSAAPAPATSVLEASEFLELLRLTITFTSVLVDHVAATAALVLACKMLPALLRLRQVLAHVQAAGLLQSTSDSDSSETPGADDTEAADLAERMAAIIATVVARR